MWSHTEFRLETLSFINCVIWSKLLITLLSVPSSVKLLYIGTQLRSAIFGILTKKLLATLFGKYFISKW